jgi:hypothetical protein
MTISKLSKGRDGAHRGALAMAAVLLLAVGCAVDEGDGELRLEPGDGEVEDEPGDADAAGARGASDALTSDDRPVAVLPGFDLSIEVAGGDVTLAWADMGPGVVYEVFRSEQPYFAPGGTTSTKLADVSGLAYVDEGAGGPGRAFYQVRAYFPAGYFEGSTTVGKKVTPLYKGYTKLSQCLISEVDTSEELCAEIGPAAISAHMWDEVTQAWTWWWNGTPGPGLQFSTGDVVSINLGHDHPSQHVAVGYVPADDDVVIDLLPGDNLVTVLPARFGDLMASELLAAVPHATRIGYWDAASQVTLWYPGEPDFAITACSDVHVEVSEPSQWPPPLPSCPCVRTMPVWEDVVGGTIAPTEMCYDEEHTAATGVLVPGEDGLVAARFHEDSPYPEYKLMVGALTENYVIENGLDSSLVGVSSCLSYDDRQGEGQVLYQMVSDDEALACEGLLRQAFTTHEGNAFCSGGTSAGAP